MADHQLPCDGDGNCMLCKKNPSEEEKILCKTCVTPWHVECLPSPPESMASVAEWECPDCSPTVVCGKLVNSATIAGVGGELVAKIKAIEADTSLSETEKARKRQELLSGSGSGGNDQGKVMDDNEILAILGDNMSCSFCMQLPERPVTVKLSFSLLSTCIWGIWFPFVEICVITLSSLCFVIY